MRWTLGLLCVAALAANADAADPGPETTQDIRAKGQIVAEQYCGACHATGKTGSSSNPNAPVFRTIFARQPAGAIAEDLREGLKIGHKTMPRVQLPPDDVDALVTYLASIQDTQI
jgi:mono/diheme cytochrome c family protein